MKDRETPRIHKCEENKIDSNYDGNCTSRDFQFGTQKISGRLIFVEQCVHFQYVNLILTDPCIVNDSVEIPTRCSFVIEFIITKFLMAEHVSRGTPLIIRRSKLYLQPLVYMPIW
jgi:hypothetical protein